MDMSETLDDIMEVVKRTMGDGSYIASSACKMAAERSNDAGVNPIVTFILMRELCRVNIDAQKEVITKGAQFSILCRVIDKNPVDEVDKMTGIIEELAIDLVNSKGAIHKVNI